MCNRSPEPQYIHDIFSAIERMDTLSLFFAADFLGKPAWVWLSFIGIVVALLAFVLHKDDKEIGVRESLLLSAGYISAAVTFGASVQRLRDAGSLA